MKKKADRIKIGDIVKVIDNSYSLSIIDDDIVHSTTLTAEPHEVTYIYMKLPCNINGDEQGYYNNTIIVGLETQIITFIKAKYLRKCEAFKCSHCGEYTVSELPKDCERHKG